MQDLARSYKRRRRGAQIAGGAVLSAGLVVGAINAPALWPGKPSTAVTMPAASSAPPSPAESDKDRAAFFAAGYTYEDAARLAKLWHKKDPYQVKAEAGKKLRAGEELPFKPQPVKGDPTEAKRQKQLDAYFAAGYGTEDAVQLAKLWKLSDPYQAKILGGEKLLAGQTLPVQP